ncbi:MAG: hypothetical protein U9R22_14855 [Pseudomonadota bacterium]|nr:hypothetical protein [Pseudomonadota bacterium]
MSHFFEQLMDNPLAVRDNTYDQGYQLGAEQLQRFHLHWAAKRFAELRPRISVLDKLAREQGINAITDIEQLGHLLFAHSVYKSYPMSYLERNRFDMLTKWLAKLTSTDLSHIDASAIETIDEWLDLLDAQTPLMVLHSSGTTGKLSFLPRTKAQSRDMATIAANILRDWNGPHSRPDMLVNHRPLINPGYRYGAGTAQRMAGVQVELYAGGDDNALFLYPNQRLSADLISLAGRLRTAEARGEQGRLEISPGLLRRRDELIEMEKQRPQAIANFLETARTRFAGQDVYIGTLYGMVYDWAVEGLAKGHSNIFGPDSFLSCGGGTKGRVFPDDWRETIQTFLGFSTFSETYAMTESMGMATLCEQGHYHLAPFTVPFLLDPRTGAQLPRVDGTSGRFAFLDLLPDNYWAGMVSGDAVTMGGFQQPCGCGRQGYYVHKDVRRYSDMEGGDDKVLCSGAPEAHDKALAFLTETLTR